MSKKSKPKMLDLNGIHLWAVGTNIRPEENKLWITTEKESAALAVRKAEAFERKRAGRRAAVYIKDIHYRGTIDA